MRVLSEFVVGRAIDDWRYFLAQERGIEIAVNLPLTYFQDPTLSCVCATACRITLRLTG